ncbi:MAG: hypothetical protein OCD01_15470 [Fibrobacterales bacterium]
MHRYKISFFILILLICSVQSNSPQQGSVKKLFTVTEQRVVSTTYSVFNGDTILSQDTSVTSDTLFMKDEHIVVKPDMDTYTVSKNVADILDGMTLEEKAGQLIIVYHSNFRFLSEHKVGAVLIMQNMLKKPGKLVENLKFAQDNMHIPLLVTIDQEGGQINRLKKVPGWKSLPSAFELGTWDEKTIEEHAFKVGQKLRELGVNTNLAPVLDPSLDQFGLGTFMLKTKRSFGANADSIYKASTAFMQGMNRAGILCVTKHYPGYDAEENSDHEITVSNADSLFIYQNMKVFNKAMDRASGVMINSIHYPNMCSKPAVFCPEIIEQVRRVNPHKIIMTDDLWGASLRGYVSNTKKVHRTRYPKKDLVKLVEMLFAAGNDMLMTTYPKTVPVIVETVVKMAKSDPKYMEQLNMSVKRILEAKESIGLLNRVELKEWRARYNGIIEKKRAHDGKYRAQSQSEPETVDQEM